jgi:hypothetical protein
MSETPCLCSSPITLSIAGALSPSGSGNHGFDKTSPIAASMLSFDCKIKQIKHYYYSKNLYLKHFLNVHARSLGYRLSDDIRPQIF